MASITNHDGETLIDALPGCYDCDDAATVARRIARNINEPVMLHDDDGDWFVLPDGSIERVECTPCKGFKVCSMDSEGKRFFSASLRGERIEYKKQVFVHRPSGCGPLTVFRTIRHAKKAMARRDWSLALFSCEFIPSDDLYVWADSCRHLQDMPRGTRLADSVKLIKRLELWA